MMKVLLIGQGNVASHLYRAFSTTENVSVQQINSRNLINIPLVDIIILAVSDDAISLISKQLDEREELVTHTSGTVNINAIEQKRKAVFYPLQSFTKSTEIKFSNIPFCLETNHKTDYKLIEELANSISEKSYKISSQQRKKLHLAAVFVNNFTNHMYSIANEICNSNQVPFEILQPLIEETSKKIQKISPIEAQTGPAKRKDEQTIKNHLEQLNSQQKEIYKIITKSIQEN